MNKGHVSNCQVNFCAGYGLVPLDWAITLSIVDINSYCDDTSLKGIESASIVNSLVQ